MNSINRMLRSRRSGRSRSQRISRRPADASRYWKVDALTPPRAFLWRFLLGGWYPGRKRKLRGLVPQLHPALYLLQSFSGVHLFPFRKGGMQCATSDVRFQHLDKNGYDGVVADWDARLELGLVGIADYHYEHGYLWLSNDGRYFSSSCVSDEFCFVADDFSQMLRTMLFGYWVRPLMPPNHETLEIYGVQLYRNDARLYDWER